MAIIKNKVIEKIIFLWEKLLAFVIRNMIGKLRKIKGKFAALINADIPKNTAHKIKRYIVFFI